MQPVEFQIRLHVWIYTGHKWPKIGFLSDTLYYVFEVRSKMMVITNF